MLIDSYKKDKHRLNLNEEQRLEVHNLILKYLNRYNLKYIEIKGSEEDRKIRSLKKIFND